MASKRKQAATSAAASAKLEADFLASLYAYGFQFRDNHERDFVSDCVAHGHGPSQDIAQMKSVSLMHGTEAWNQLVACARSIQAAEDFSDPLLGRDLLTFVGRVLNARSERGRGVKKRRAGNAGQLDGEGGSAVKKTRTRVEKGSRRSKESPFWVTAPVTGDADNVLETEAVIGEAEIDKEKGPRRQRRHSTHDTTADGDVEAIETRVSAEDMAVSQDQAHHIPDGSTIKSHSEEHAKMVCEAAILPRPAVSSAEDTRVDWDSEQIVAPPNARTPGKPERLGTPDNNGPEECLTLSMIKNAENTFDISKDNERDFDTRSEARKRVTRSSFFATPTPEKQAKTLLKSKSPRPPRGTVSCLPFPRLDVPRFGLAQENYMEDPYRLLIAVTFLIRTKGTTSMPVFRELIAEYPLPKDLMEADPVVIEAKIRHLGLSNNRTASIQKYARIWAECPPQPGARYGVKNYPNKGDGKDVRAGELLDDDDPRESAWEIGHLTQGRYAIDSWRIFCRDIFLGKEDARLSKRNGTKTRKGDDGHTQRRTRGQRKSEVKACLQPEWMRVLPEDKELRAYLRWMWMREGWEWDPMTGEKTVLSREMYNAVQEGRVVWDNTGKLVIVAADDSKKS